MYYSIKWYKEPKKLLSLLLAFILALSTLTSSITIAQESTSPLQKVLIEAMAIDADDKRDAFIDEILNPLNSQSDVDSDIVNNVRDNYFTMTNTDIETALSEYSVLGVANKNILEQAISEGLPDLSEITNFDSIKSMINQEVTGEPDDVDNKGLRFLTKLLQTIKEVSSNPIAKDDINDEQKILLEYTGSSLAESVISSLIDSIETLKNQISTAEGSNNLEKLLSYYEVKINESSPSEINAFKVFLKNNGNLYEGTANNDDHQNDDNNANNDFASFNVNFDSTDKENTYFEFKTTSDDIYNNANRIEFRLGGEYKDDILPVNLSNQYNDFRFLDKYNLEIIEVESSAKITLSDDAQINGYIRNPGDSLIGFEIDLPEGSINPDKTYRIKINSDFHNAIFSSAVNSVVKSDTITGENFEFRLKDTNNMNSGDIHFKTMDWDNGASLSVRELTDNSSNITLMGNIGVKYPFEIQNSLTDIKELDFYFFSDFNDTDTELINSIKNSYEGSEATFGDLSASSISTEFSNENNIGLKFSISFDEVLDFSSKKELSFEGESGAILNKILAQKLPNSNYEFILALKDSTGSIKAWNSITDKNSELIIDPKFNFNIPKDENENNIPYVGYNEELSNIDGSLIQTGESSSDNIVVDGTTTYTSNGEEISIPFILSFYKDISDMNNITFKTNPRFENKSYEYAETVEDIENGIQANVIPVYPLSENEITLTYKYKDKEGIDQEETITFDWERGELNPNELWGWATTAENFWGIGPNSHVDVKIYDLQSDDLSKLKLKGKYTRIVNDDISTLTLLQLAKTEDVTSLYANDTDYYLEDNAKVIRFSYNNGDINELYGDEVNDAELKIHLEYYDDKGTDEIEDDIENSQEIMQTRVDNQAPSIDVMYNGLYDGENTDLEDYHGVVVRFNDEININNVIENQESYFSLQNKSGTELAKATAIEGYREEHEGNNPDDPYRSVILYFPEINSNNYLNVKNISDRAGNKISAPVSKKIDITGRISGHVQYSDGSRVSNARVDMVLLESILNADFDSGKVDIIQRTLETDANGDIFDTHLDAGLYKAYRVEIPYTPQNEPYDVQGNLEDEEDGEDNPTGDTQEEDFEDTFDEKDSYNSTQEVYIDQNIKVEFSKNMDESQEVIVTIPNTENVSGSVTLDPEYPEEKLELLVIKTDYLKAPWNTIDKHMLYEFFGNRIMVSATPENDGLYTEGTFSTYLGSGEYKVIGKTSGMSYIPPVSEYLFTVPETGDYVLPKPIEFPKMNIVGKISGSDDEPIDNATVVIRNKGATGDDIKSSAMTNSDGLFATVLEEGSYTIPVVEIRSDGSQNNGILTLDINFDVNSDGKVENVTGTHLKAPAEGEENTLKDIKIPDTNLNVKVTSGTDVVDGASLELVFENEDGGPWIWSNTGEFDFFLLEGNYKFSGVGSHDMFIENLNYEFTVDSEGNVLILDENGQSVDTEGSIIIDMTSNSNVVITIEDQSGNPIIDANVGIEGINNGVMQWRNTDSNGKAYFNVEQGKYRVPGYNDSTGWYQLDEEFTVGTEKVEKTFKLKVPNVKGTVLDSSNDPIQNGWLNIQKIPGETELFSEYFGASTNEEGYFSLFLDPGEYLIEGIGTIESWEELNYKFYVVEDDEGNLKTQIEEDGELTDVDDNELVVKKPSDNIKGKVYKNSDEELFIGRADEDGYDENWPIDVWLVLKQANVSEEKYNEAPWIFEKWVEVDSEGNFGTLVDKSKEYIAEAVVNKGKWITLTPDSISTDSTVPEESLNNGIIIPNTSAELTIIPPAPNFSGTIIGYDNEPLGPGWINVEKIDSEGNYSGWHGMEIEDNGAFSMTLEEDQEYLIRDVSIMDMEKDDPWMNSKYYSFNKKITIGDDSTGLELKLNTKCLIDLGKEIDTGDYEHYQLSAQIRRVVDPSDDDYEDYQMNPWKYETWANMDFDSENTTYEIITHLDIGDYILTGIPTQNGYIDVNHEFTISDADQNLIEIDANPNVTGTVKDSEGNGIAYAWIDIQKVDNTITDTYNNWDSNRWFGTNTDSEGKFSLKLNDSPENGYYKINSYNTQGYWQGYHWIQGERVEVNYTFKVIDGNLMKADGITPLEKIEISTNVTGTFMQKYNENKDNPDYFIDPEDGEYAKVKDAWLTIKPLKEDQNGNTYIDYGYWEDTIWANTGSNGEFELMLGDGKYMVVDAGTPYNWFKLEIPFEIKDGMMVENNYLNDGVFEIKPPEPNMSGTLYRDTEREEAIKWGWFSIKPANASEYDWSNVKWFNTDKDGNFSGYLPQGNWKITEISGPGYWERVSIPLTVDSDEIVSCPWDEDTTPVDQLIVQEDGSLTISLREPNVTGIIKDKDGNTLYENAQVTIKPTSDSEYEWSNVTNCEYKNVDGTFMFQTKLEPGEYKIVNISNWNFWYETNTVFKVNESGEMEEVTDDTFTTITKNDEELTAVIVQPPQPNVTGTVYSGESTSSETLNYGWLGIARFDSSGNQLTMDGIEITPANGGYKSPYDEYYWQYTRWTGTDENGEFEFSLNDGIYKIISVNGMNTWYQPETNFIVEDNMLKDMSGNTISELNVTKPSANMSITVKNSNADENVAWLDILDTTSGNIINVESDKKDSENNFVFEEILKDGTYSLVGFYSSGIWEEIESSEFTIPTDGEFVYDFNSNTKISVNGQLYTTEDTEAGSGYWISIQKVENQALAEDKKQVQTNSDGSFEFNLDPDETWAIVAISNKDGVYKYSNPEATNLYEVKDTPSTQDGWTIVLDEID